MKVNMTPNPLDVVTIHASQGDTEARQWEFELHNNGELIDTSEITEQLFFKAYKGGTEQILPENTSTPTTSPFLGDIRYPQGLLTDQEFTYRQSPTEEDGLAKITDIKGNTSVWNQNCYSFFGLRSTLSSAINSQTDITCTASSGQTSFGIIIQHNTGYFNFIGGHTYLLSMNISEITVNNFSRISPESALNPQTVARETGRYTTICNPTVSGPRSILCYLSGTTTTSDNFKFNSVQIVDLTMLNDSRITDLDSFKSYYPLDYYSYNQGSLLSFMGNGIKTVGKNQAVNVVKGFFNNQSSTITINNGGESFVFYAWQGKTYYASSSIALNRNVIAQCDTPNLVNGSPIYNPINFGNTTEKKWTATWTGWTVWYVYNDNNDNVHNSAQVEIGTTATAYEPYTESTLSLPISTYFPTGMKSAGSVYDELTESKAITRVGIYELGLLDWTTGSGWTQARDSSIVGAKAVDNAQIANIICPVYTAKSANEVFSKATDKTIAISQGGYVQIYDSSFANKTTAEIKQLLSGVYLCYELATPTETSFTTASLVTENAEIPLSNEDGTLIGKSTEELSAEPGFHDAKIKLSDADGECYSNKLQLHVERSPQ